MSEKSKVLVIYTGGTIGMVQEPATGRYKPFNFDHLLGQLPELRQIDVVLSTFTFDSPIDSSNMNPNDWVDIALVIEKNYKIYDGFVILHGSDTMAYTASALSFMLEGLVKPVILTGSQLPIGVVRTDGKENLITAIEIAGAKHNGESIVKEVALYFEYQLLRGNRCYKSSAEYFDAFRSENYPKLAEAGVRIDYNYAALLQPEPNQQLVVNQQMDGNVAILKLFPGINEATVRAFVNIDGLKAIVLETFGSGNATTASWFIQLMKEAIIEKEIIIVNITQCQGGSVDQGRYETSGKFNEIGIISGFDLTTEAAVTKLMYLLTKNLSKQEFSQQFTTPLRGELTINV